MFTSLSALSRVFVSLQVTSGEKSLVAHASLSMSFQRDSGRGAAGFVAKKPVAGPRVVSENSFVLTVDMKLGVSERCAAPLASFPGCSDEEPRCP